MSVQGGGGLLPKTADVVVIGGGIVGCAIARELSRYALSTVVLEATPDVASGTSKANSGILHAGFDAEPGTWKARLNVRGSRLYAEISEELGIPRRQVGSLVVATEKSQLGSIEELRQRGRENGVTSLEVLLPDQIRAREPNLTPDVTGALWAPSAAIICPFLATIGFAENAIRNGVRIITECAVTGLDVVGGAVKAVRTNLGRIEAGYVVNAAGVHTGDIARMAGDQSFTITPRRGEYILFDRSVGDLVHSVVFPTPSKVSKGILIAPTVHGNAFIGPNACEIGDPDDVDTTGVGFAEIISGARRLLPNVPLPSAITEFAGVRASAGKDFIIAESPAAKRLIHAAGIQSPGLSAAPAIAETIVECLADAGLKLWPNRAFIPVNDPRPKFTDLSRIEQADLIAKDPRYGRVICRCETITEGEIVAAVRAPCGARTLDGMKRRVRTGMGRCQAGFCGPLVTAIIARELGMSVTDVRKDGTGSWMFLPRADLKTAEQEHE